MFFLRRPAARSAWLEAKRSPRGADKGTFAERTPSLAAFSVDQEVSRPPQPVLTAMPRNRHRRLPGRLNVGAVAFAQNTGVRKQEHAVQSHWEPMPALQLQPCGSAPRKRLVKHPFHRPHGDSVSVLESETRSRPAVHRRLGVGDEDPPLRLTKKFGVLAREVSHDGDVVSIVPDVSDLDAIAGEGEETADGVDPPVEGVRPCGAFAHGRSISPAPTKTQPPKTKKPPGRLDALGGSLVGFLRSIRCELRCRSSSPDRTFRRSVS
jgi:hypothetical protein